MPITHANSRTFQSEVLDSPTPVLVDFTASWCGPCRAMNPVLDALVAERDDVRIVKVDADENMDLIAGYGVMGFPTFVLLEAGREVGRIRGAMPRRRFEAALDELLAGARA